MPSKGATFGTASHRKYTYRKVQDGRKQPIRGLWERNGRFYARLKVENPLTGKQQVRRELLKGKDGEPASTVAQARAALDLLIQMARRTARLTADFTEWLERNAA
jgi:hypothetical protein